MNNSIEINGFQDGSIAYCEAKGLARCFLTYANTTPAQTIQAVGFNANSGYTYIALEDGITICSCLGRDVEFLVTDSDSGDETFYDTYEQAVEALA